MTGGLALPPAGAGVSDQTVAFAAELTDRSGQAPVIEAALARRTGRPRPLPVRAVLTALLCLALEDRPLFLTEATRILFQQLSPASRRLRDHRDPEDGKGKPLRKIFWAVEATIATTARLPGAPPATPNLAIGMAMARPGEDPGGTGARVLASVAARGHKTGPLGYDRAYTQALPERFHLPVRALGYHAVMDYRDDQLGIQANTGGAILVEGSWYCPALPGPLITATTRLRDHAITAGLYDQQIAARCPYQLRHKDGPGADGYQRLSCPAAGRHPGLICPLRPASLSPRDGRAKALQPPPEPPKACTQTAITIAPDIGARYRQDLPYGSPAWHHTYAALRNTIEGLNGYLKDPARQALAQPARRRVRGIAAQSIFTALLLTAANIRKDPRLARPDRPR
jgi:hypothetical protein